MSNKLKIILNCLGAIIASISLLVSCISIHHSNEANKIAKLSKKQGMTYRCKQDMRKEFNNLIKQLRESSIRCDVTNLDATREGEPSDSWLALKYSLMNANSSLINLRSLSSKKSLKCKDLLQSIGQLINEYENKKFEDFRYFSSEEFDSLITRLNSPEETEVLCCIF